MKLYLHSAVRGVSEGSLLHPFSQSTHTVGYASASKLAICGMLRAGPDMSRCLQDRKRQWQAARSVLAFTFFTAPKPLQFKTFFYSLCMCSCVHNCGSKVKQQNSCKCMLRMCQNTNRLPASCARCCQQPTGGGSNIIQVHMTHVQVAGEGIPGTASHKHAHTLTGLALCSMRCWDTVPITITLDIKQPCQ